MGKHLKIDPLPEPIKPGIHDLGIISGARQAAAAAGFVARHGREGEQFAASLLHIDHRGDGSTQPVAPTPPDRIAEGWALVPHRDRKRLATKYPELITAIVRHIERND